MEEDRIAKAEDLLRQASNTLMAEVPVSSQTTATATRPETPSRTVLPSSSSVADTLRRARSMMDTSSRQGLYRRLNRNERPRAGSVEGKHAKKVEKKTKIKDSKPFEFALLHAYLDQEDDDNDNEDTTLRKERIAAHGMVVLEDRDNELQIRQKIKLCLEGKYEIVGENDFEFVKVN
eukprot:gene6639-7387_t